MQEVLYGFFLVGSFSVGYSLVRTAFPKVQLKKITTKILYSYLFGLIVFETPLIVIYLFEADPTYFFGLCLFLYSLMFIIMYAKRRLFKEIEIIQKMDKNETAQIPSFILEKDAAERRIMFEKGLMVKSSGSKITSPGELKKQIFGKTDNTIIQFVDKKTKEMEKLESEVQKRETLKKLRAIAKEMSKRKTSEINEAEEQDIIEKELLENMTDEK